MIVGQLWGVCQRIESWIATQRGDDSDSNPSVIPVIPAVQHSESKPLLTSHNVDVDPTRGNCGNGDGVFAVMQWPFVTPDSVVHAGDTKRDEMSSVV